MPRTPTPKTLKPIEGYSAMLDPEIVSTATPVATDMPGNTNYQTPPVDLAVFKTDIDTLSALIAQSKDGSKKVIIEKNKQRALVVKKLRLFGRYVELYCKDDPAIFASSGFKIASATKTPPPAPLPAPTIDKVTHNATSGQLVVQLKAHRKAITYRLRYASAVSGGTLAPWIELVVTAVRPATTITGLTPGTIYAFQVQALGKLGYSDWSDSFTFMCT